jgi:hypothetical protein
VNGYPEYSILRNNVNGLPDNLDVDTRYELAITLSMFLANNHGIDRIPYGELLQLNQQRLNAENHQQMDIDIPQQGGQSIKKHRKSSSKSQVGGKKLLRK